jgi:hypothetical protein
MLAVILLVLALICFIAATFNLTTRVNLLSLGLALWVGAVLIGGGDVIIRAD